MLIGPIEFTVDYKVDGLTVTEFDARAFAYVTPGQPAYTPRGEMRPTDPPTDDEVCDYCGFEVEVFERVHTAEERAQGKPMWKRTWIKPDETLERMIRNWLEAGNEDDRFIQEMYDILADDPDLRARSRSPISSYAGGAA